MITLSGALKTLFCLHRWNVKPRVETWTEAENVAICCHVAYAAGKIMGLEEKVLHHAIKRTLFKSNYKYVLSDISIPVRELMDKNEPAAWQKIRRDVDNRLKNLFPSSVAADLHKYFSLSGQYGVDPSVKTTIEDLVKFAKYRVALCECEINGGIFPENYKDHVAELRIKLEDVLRNEILGSLQEGKKARAGLDGYLLEIRNLKYVRRWNRLNRFIESSVLAHTFLVAFLAVLFSEIEEKKLQAIQEDFQYQCVLLALFHDVPEGLTGDIIAPVKDLIEQHAPGLLPQIEGQATEKMRTSLPAAIQKDIEEKNLFKEPSKEEPFSVASLVLDCDRLAGMLECAFEMSVGNDNPEIVAGFQNYYKYLQNSEWAVVREFSHQVRYEQEVGLF